MRRVLGRSGPELSAICFGSMRLAAAGGPAQAAALLTEALDRGVTTFHVSEEYESWPLFVEAWRAAGLHEGRKAVEIIAKMASPHFGEDRFDPAVLDAKLDRYRTALGVDRIDVAQWLLRHDLKQEPERLAILERSDEAIAAFVHKARGDGRIRAFVSFPYTRGVAERAAVAPWSDGLAIYLNPLELELSDLLPTLAQQGKGAVAIRPFAAGRVFEPGGAGLAALGEMLALPAVATVILSVSSAGHLHAALEAAEAGLARVQS